jgi:hypothetical protein
VINEQVPDFSVSARAVDEKDEQIFIISKAKASLNNLVNAIFLYLVLNCVAHNASYKIKRHIFVLSLNLV